jgi:hypothetical protein
MMAAAALSVLGSVGTMLSGIQQANAQAKGARSEAKSIEEQAAFQEQQSRRQSRMLIGKQIAVGAASGVDITSGSPLFMELDSVKQAELEALNIRHQGALGSASKKFEARMAKARIPGIIMGGVAQAGGALAAGGDKSVLAGWMKPSNPASSVSSWSAGRPAPWR